MAIDNNKKEFATYIDGSSTFLFIDEKLIISFLKALPKEYSYNILMGINLRGYGIIETIRHIEICYSEEDNSELNDLLDIVNNPFKLGWMYPKIHCWYLRIYLYLINYKFKFLPGGKMEDVNKKLKENWHNEIYTLYHLNMSSEERKLLRIIGNKFLKSWIKEK